MKPRPHHKRVRVPFAAVANGYGGEHKFRGLSGLWQIIAADTDPRNYPSHVVHPPHPNSMGMICLIVAPARGGK
jgi:hypothetical protein